MTRQRRLLLPFLLFFLLGGVAGAAGIWFFFFNGQAPAAADINAVAGDLAIELSDRDVRAD